MLAALMIAVTFPVSFGPDTLAAVDLYGLRTVSESAVRAAIGLRAGDPTPDSTEHIRSRVLAIPGVEEVDISTVCCSETGGSILYVGIRETGTPPLTFRTAPTGAARLPTNIVAAGERFLPALFDAVQRGVTGEDYSKGYSLARDSTVRSIQEDFIVFATHRFDTLAAVLHGSAEPAHRALAALMLAYGTDRPRVARELVRAIDDPADEVRNNATRGLAVLIQWANQHPDAGIVVPAAPFIDFLQSVSWTDRNKGVFVFTALTATRDSSILQELRARAVPSLIEMARWSSEGHALGAFMILARIAGVRDADAYAAYQAGERERIIRQVLQSSDGGR